MDVDTHVPELGCTVGEALLAVHREYLTVMEPLLSDDRVHGLAHITGGGFFDNIERVLPDGCRARIDKSAWEPLPVFRMLCEVGDLDDREAYRVFNMGIGLVVVVDSGGADEMVRVMSGDWGEARVIGEVVAGERAVDLT